MLFRSADFLRIYPTGSFSALTGAYSGFGDHAHFWTVTEGDMSCRNFYSKKFVDLKGTVTQIEAMPASKLTIRLVKDFVGDNYHKFEEIHGRLYEKKLVASESEECNQVWTMVNVDIADYDHDLVPTPMPEDATTAITTDYAFYINRWDGYKWDKVEMTEGDCVVILGEEGANPDCPMAEFRLECGELVNQDKRWQDQIDDLASAATASTEAIEELKERVDALEKIVGEGLSGETLTDAINDLRDKLEDEISARTEADEALQEQIDELSGTTEELKEDVEALSATTEDLKSDVEELSGTTEELKEDVEELSGATQTFVDTLGNVNDVPTKPVDVYKPEDLLLSGGTMTVFEFINSTNDYGYWDAPNEDE